MPVGYQGHFRYAKFEPILVHLTHVVTCVGSNNLIYALTVVIIFRSILLPKILSQTWVSTFKISCFGPIWPKVCHSCHITTCPPPLESHLRPWIRWLWLPMKGRQKYFHWVWFLAFLKIPHDTVERASDLHVKATKKYTGFDAAA